MFPDGLWKETAAEAGPAAARAPRRTARATSLRMARLYPDSQSVDSALWIASAAMFVFKAAVVGAGTMGGEIAQVVASAGIPVVLKDVKQEFVDTGLEKARQVTEAQLGNLVEKEKITQENADAQQAEILGRITGTTDYGGFGDVDFVDRGRAGADGDQAGRLLRARRGHARPRHPRLQHVVALDHRDGRGDAAARQGVSASTSSTRPR